MWCAVLPDAVLESLPLFCNCLIRGQTRRLGTAYLYVHKLMCERC